MCNRRSKRETWRTRHLEPRTTCGFGRRCVASRYDFLSTRFGYQMMVPGKDVDEWGGSEWVEMPQEEQKRDEGLAELVKQVLVCLSKDLEGYPTSGVPGSLVSFILAPNLAY